jgi:type IV secretion system protein VirD4
LFGLTNVLVMFGGSKDGAFNQEISDLAGRTFSGDDIAIIRPEEIRRSGTAGR